MFKLIQSKTSFQGKVFDVRHDRVRLPNGQFTTLDIIAHPPAVVLLPVDNTNLIWFVRQYRHAAERLILELPAGVIEPDETPEDCALREIREEIGMSATRSRKSANSF